MYAGDFIKKKRAGNCRPLSTREIPHWRIISLFLGRGSTRHKAKLTAFVKALNSELAIDGVDFMRSEVSVDYGRPNWVYKASSNSRLAAGPQRARPSDDASVDFTGFRHRHISAPPR